MHFEFAPTNEIMALDVDKRLALAEALRSGDYDEGDDSFLFTKHWNPRVVGGTIDETSIVGVSCFMDGFDEDDLYNESEVPESDTASKFTRDLELAYLELPEQFNPTFEEFADLLEGKSVDVDFKS